MGKQPCCCCCVIWFAGWKIFSSPFPLSEVHKVHPRKSSCYPKMHLLYLLPIPSPSNFSHFSSSFRHLSKPINHPKVFSPFPLEKGEMNSFSVFAFSSSPLGQSGQNFPLSLFCSFVRWGKEELAAEEK